MSDYRKLFSTTKKRSLLARCVWKLNFMRYVYHQYRLINLLYMYIFQEFHQKLGIDDRKTRAYHPMANGLVEAHNKILKT